MEPDLDVEEELIAPNKTRENSESKKSSKTKVREPEKK